MSDQNREALMNREGNPNDARVNHDITVSDVNAEAIRDLSIETFDIICSKCQRKDSLDSVAFVTNRQPLEVFLNESDAGQTVLIHFKKYESLSDSMLDTLTRLLISREMTIIFKQKKVSLDNPLRHVQ